MVRTLDRELYGDPEPARRNPRREQLLGGEQTIPVRVPLNLVAEAARLAERSGRTKARELAGLLQLGLEAARAGRDVP